MSSNLTAKTGTYTKDGVEKSEYTKLGVLLDGSNGQYILLDPALNLAGVLLKQNLLSGQARNSIMVSIFSNDRDNQQAPAQAKQGGSFNDRDTMKDDEIPF